MDDFNGSLAKDMRQDKDTYIEPILTITYVASSWDRAPIVRTATFVGAASCPHNLAKAFLDFVSMKATPATEDELRQVTNVICEIHQRGFAETKK